MTDSDENFESADDGDTDSAASDKPATAKHNKQAKEVGPTPGSPGRGKKKKKQKKKKGAVEELKGEVKGQKKAGGGGAEGSRGDVKTGNKENVAVKVVRGKKEEKEETEEAGKDGQISGVKDGENGREKAVLDDGQMGAGKEEAPGEGNGKKEEEKKEEEQGKDGQKEEKSMEDAATEGQAEQKSEGSESAVVSQPEQEDMERQARLSKDPHLVLDELAEVASEKSSWFSGIGTSLLSTATASVSTFTHSVGEGISSVLEAVDEGLGIPPADDMAKEVSEEEKKEQEAMKAVAAEIKDEPATLDVTHDSPGVDGQQVTEQAEGQKPEQKGSWYSGWGIGGLVSSVQEKSKALVDGGLDALENLGKQTYNILAEGEHGIKKVVASGRERPVLSQVLQDAKIQAEHRAKAEQETEEKRKRQFLAQFDECQGLVKLQALEMLSSESSAQVHQTLSSLPPQEQVTVRMQLTALDRHFEITDQELEESESSEDQKSFSKVVKDVTDILDIQSNPNKLLQTHDHVLELANTEVAKEEKEEGEPAAQAEHGKPALKSEDGKPALITVHENSIQALAQLTAAAVQHQLHLGQLLLLRTGEEGEVTADTHEMRAQALKSLTLAFCSEISRISELFTQKIVTNMEDTKERTEVITNIYVEASNSSTYIQEGLRLLMPVMQKAALPTS